MSDSDDLRSAVQMLAADNARLCERLIAAEKVITAARKFVAQPFRKALIEAALDVYDAGKPS